VSRAGELLVALAMLVGLAGVFVPVLPGLALIWAAGLVWAWLDGGGPLRWSVLAVMTLLLVGGTVAKYVLPARSATTSGAPRTTLLLGGVGALAGFFLIPVVGLPAGFVVGVYVAELARLADGGAAWRSTRGVLLAVGIGMLVELTAGIAMVLAWLFGVLIT
jgi:uncharacterized protein